MHTFFFFLQHRHNQTIYQLFTIFFFILGTSCVLPDSNFKKKKNNL